MIITFILSLFISTSAVFAMPPTGNRLLDNNKVNDLCRSSDQESEDVIQNRDLLDHLLVDEYSKAIYCRVPDVDDENLKRLTLSFGSNSNDLPDILELQEQENHLYNLMRPLSEYEPEEAEFRLRNYLKVLMARHPFERIFDFYRQNIEKRTSHDSTNQIETEIKKVFDVRTLTDDISTFQDFILYINSHNVSDYLRPVFDMCRPCHVNYDVIGKYEGLVDELSPQSYQSASAKDARALYIQYFHQLTDELLVHLNIIYEMDFAFFNFQYFDNE